MPGLLHCLGLILMSEITNSIRSIVLNDVEQKIVKHIAQRKRQYFEGRNIGPILSTPRTRDRLRHYIEAWGAEYAFCILHNVYPPTEIIDFDDYDVSVPGIGAVDIKSTQRMDGRLIINLKKAKSRANGFALMCGSFPSYVFGGWLWTKDAINQSNLTDLGYGECYAIEQERLNRDLMICVTR